MPPRKEFERMTPVLEREKQFMPSDRAATVIGALYIRSIEHIFELIPIIVDAPWCVPNNHIRRDLQMTSVKEEISRSSNQYSTRFTTHPNDQILTFMGIPGNRRLRRHVPNDLPDRFLL
jgi:hypothetical protein